MVMMMMKMIMITIIIITATIKIVIINKCRNNFFTGETEEVYFCMLKLNYTCHVSTKNAFSLGRTRKQLH